MTVQTYDEDEPRPVSRAMLRGAAGRCPHCGEGRLFCGFLKVRDHCTVCGEALHHHRADDAPPYVVIFLVGHLVVGLALAVEVAYRPPMWAHMALWVALTLVLAVGFLQPVKGALIGLQWALRMHGFDPASTEAQLSPESEAPR